MYLSCHLECNKTEFVFQGHVSILCKVDACMVMVLLFIDLLLVYNNELLCHGYQCLCTSALVNKCLKVIKELLQKVHGAAHVRSTVQSFVSCVTDTSYMYPLTSAALTIAAATPTPCR